jgi:hypothetical protein
VQGPAYRASPDEVASLGQFALQQRDGPPRGLMAVRLGIGCQQGLQHHFASGVQFAPPPTVRGVTQPGHSRLAPGRRPGIDAGAAAVQALRDTRWALTGRQQLHRLIPPPAPHPRLRSGSRRQRRPLAFRHLHQHARGLLRETRSIRSLGPYGYLLSAKIELWCAATGITPGQQRR